MAPAPRTSAEVEARYRELVATHEQTQINLSTGRSTVLRLLAGVGVALVLLSSKALQGGASPWPFVVAFVAIVVLIWLSMRRQKRLARQQRTLAHYDRALRRVDGSEAAIRTYGHRPSPVAASGQPSV